MIYAVERNWYRVGGDGPLAKMIAILEDGRWQVIGRVVDVTEYEELPPNPPAFEVELLAVNTQDKTAMFFGAGVYDSFERAVERILRSFAHKAPIKPSAMYRFDMKEVA